MTISSGSISSASAGPSPALLKQQQDIEHKISVMRACQTTPRAEKQQTIQKLDQQLNQVGTAIQTSDQQASDTANGDAGFTTFSSNGGALPLVNIVV